MNKLKSYSLELISLIGSGKIKTKRQLNEKKIVLCKKHGLSSLPTNPDVLAFAKKRTKLLLNMLSVKPTRSLSGITVVALMTKPHNCPGKCIYCPSSLIKGKDTPQSYTGSEPATMRALTANFSPKKQVSNRIDQLHEAGHDTSKLQLIVMGGTFLSQPQQFQKQFMLGAFNAVTGKRQHKIEGAMKSAETSKQRITGITFETRPDFCGKKEINNMLSLGGTRCELGVQTIYDRVYKKIKRGHTVKDVVNATQLLKDSAFKVTYHYMPGLPGVNLQEDKKALRAIFENQEFKPDSLKIYPCLVIEGTPLFRQWKKGLYKPFSTEKAIKLLSYAKRFVPHWIRIMRIQRDIPAQLIAAGVKKSNLRQLVQKQLHDEGGKCNCIRCREAGLLEASQKFRQMPSGKAELFVENYSASKGKECFVSLEDKNRERLFGFLRLRMPYAPFRKEITEETALVRELRVFGKPMPLHKRGREAIQHKGFGKLLLSEAEELAAKNFGAKKLLVISGVGVKPYYHSLGFKDEGLFVSKPIKA